MGLFSGLKKVVNNVLDLGGRSLNAVTGVNDTARMSYDNSVKLANLQQANNIALWNMENQYNTPTAQIARMADAGININPMTYAVGNGSMSSTAQNVSPATYHAPNYGSPGNPIDMVMSVMSGVRGLKRQDLENQMLQKDIDNYEHNHASPYKDVAEAIRDAFSNNGIVRRFVSYVSGDTPLSSKDAQGNLSSRRPGETSFDYKHRLRMNYYKKHGKFPD